MTKSDAQIAAEFDAYCHPGLTFVKNRIDRHNHIRERAVRNLCRQFNPEIITELQVRTEMERLWRIKP